MSEKRAINDATASIAGTIYQLCVALERCYAMTNGQKLFIETYGDVTVKNGQGQQIEVKHYEKDLTDSSENFWKTLHNWMQPTFAEEEYASLVLVTTQAMGVQCKFKGWNAELPQKRLQILEEIHAAALAREKKHEGDTNHKPSNAFGYQKFCMEENRREKLISVISKCTISCDAPDLIGLNTRLKQLNARHILPGKTQDYIDTLLGYLISPERVLNNAGWAVTNEDFTAKVQELTNRYRTETRTFPVDFLKSSKNTAAIQAVKQEQRLFVKKIEEIDHHQEINVAIREYIYTKRTVAVDLKKYELQDEEITQFQEDVELDFNRRYRKAIADLKQEMDAMAQSRAFYDTVVNEAPPSLGDFGASTRKDFRNGMIHLHMDDNKKGLKWRLK
jgi:hypothetical protein